MPQQPHDASSPSLKRAARPFLRPVDSVSGTPTSAASMPRQVPRPFISPAPAESRASAGAQPLSTSRNHTPRAALVPLDTNPVEDGVVDAAYIDRSNEVPPSVEASTTSDDPLRVETPPSVNPCLSISPSDLEELLGKAGHDLADALEPACDSELTDPDEPSEGEALPDLEAIAAPWEAYDEWFDSLASPSAASDGGRVSSESQAERAEPPFDEEEAWSSLAWGEAIDDSFGGAVHHGDEGTRVGDVIPSPAAGGDDVLFADEIVAQNFAISAPPDGADAVAELEDSIDSGEGLEPSGSTSSALEAAGVLESLARRVRAGELPLEAIAAGSGDEALLASVLATLLRRR